MRSTPHTLTHAARLRRLLVLVLASTALLAACEQALGIKKAQLDPESGGSVCDDYCAKVTANCVDDKKQYEDLSTCMGVCEKLPLGQPGDQFLNSVYCRLAQAEAAAIEPGTYCASAGPTGFDPRDPINNCGSHCEAFCAIFQDACPTDFAQYNGLGDCISDCETIPAVDLPFSVNDDMTKGNTVQCRLYHVSAATQIPDLHCAHANGASPCVDGAAGGGGAGGAGAGGGASGGAGGN